MDCIYLLGNIIWLIIIFFFPFSQSLSLAERQALQRQKQLDFLKKQGLINKESEVRGGAGGDSQSVNSKKTAKVSHL